jgi:hypothetical protein
VREGEWITAYSIDRLSIEEPLSKFGEALKTKNYDEAKKAVKELYEARFNRTLWQIAYEFDRERAEAALEYLRQRYGEPEDRLWERHDELYLTWLAFRLADEYADYLRSGAGREFKAKEEFGDLLALGRWLPVELAPLFWLRLVGDAEGEAEFRAAWATAVNKWLEGMAAPYSPKKPAVARKAVELFNAFTGAGFKYEELFPPPPPKPAEAARPETAAKPEAVKPAEAKRETVKLETAKPEAVKPVKAAKPEAKPVEPVERLVAEIQKPERGLRREEKPTVKPEAGGPVGQKPPADTAVEGVVGRGLRQEVEKPETAEAVKPAEAAKPETAVKPAKPETKPAQKPAVEVEERGLRREVEKVTAKPEIKPTEVKKPEAVKPVEPAAEAVERGLRREEKPKAPIADVIPERVEAVEYLVQRFGDVLDREAAFKAKDFVVAKVKARLEKVAVKEPEFAHILAEVAEHVLSSFGRLLASPDAARHVYDALFYYFEGYQTRDGELLFARIERTVREAVRKAEEAGIPDAEYRVKQFILEIIDVLATAGERYRRDALKAVSTVEKALRATAFAGLSAAALYSVYHGLYSEAVVSSVATAVAFVEVGRFKEAVEYVQKAAKALYEAARDVFEKVKVTVQRLVELFVEAVARALAWIDEHKAYLFLMAAAAAGMVALSAVLDIWGLIELDKLAYAASLTPFVPAGVKEYSREEVFNILKNASDPYERFMKIAEEANRGEVKLAEPWESLRKLIMPRSSEEERLMWGGGVGLYSKYREDENYKRALFYAVLALEEAFSDYRSVLRKLKEAFDFYRKDVEEHEKVVQRMDVGEEPFKQDMYVADLGRLRQLAEEEEKAFKKALNTLRKKLNEYAVRYDLGDLLNVEEGVARELAEAEYRELPKFSGVNFGTKALAALIAYREYSLGRRGAFGTAAWYWLEVGGSAWLLYYAPGTAYDKAEKAKVERPAAVEELVAETFRRLFLKPGADHYSRFVELLGSGKLALMLEDKTESAYVFRLYRLEEGGGLKELDIRLSIKNVGKGERVSMVYLLEFEDVERWRGFFKQELEVAMKVAEEVKERLPVEDRLPYMLSWVDSDVAISEGQLEMGTSHLWQLAETHALFDWSDVTVSGVSLTLEGAKPQFRARTSLDKLDKAIEFSAKSGWLKMLGVEAESWDGLKQWVADHWDEVIDAVKRRLEGVKASSSFDLTRALEELKGLKSRLNDDKTAREVIAPALLLIQAEKLGVNEETLRYFGAVISGAIDGDGHVSAAMKRVGLTSGERVIALLWAAALAAHGIKAEVRRVGSAFRVDASGVGAARLAGLYFLYGPPLLEEDERIINHKLAEAVKLAAEGLDIRWERLRRRTEDGPVAADLTISVGGVAVKYNVYLREHDVSLEFHSTDRSRVELAARLLRLAGVTAEVTKVGGRDEWRVIATTDKLAGGHEKLRKALAEIVREAEKKGYVNKNTAKRWLEKLKSGITLKEGWPKYYVGLSSGGGLEVRFTSTNPDSIKQEAQRLEKMGLKRGVHFTVKMPDDGKAGYVSILKDGLAYAAWLSENCEDKEQRELAAEFVKLILLRAEEADGGKCGKVCEKAKKIVEEGRAWGSLELNFEKKVEVNGKTYVVKVIGGGAEFDEGRGSRKLLRIRITAEVDGVRGDYVITYSRRGARNAAVGFAVARGNAPEDREADAERLAAVVEALTGKRPRVYRKKNGQIVLECGREHLDGFMRYAELANAIMKWLEETSRRY